MGRGDIFLSRNYKFYDGETAKKLLILLNDPAEDSCYIFVKTTSRKKFKIDRPGCYGNHDGQGYFTIQKNRDWFDADFTWVLFHPTIIMSYEEVLKESLDRRNLEYQATLKDLTIREIVNCMRNSPYVSGYIRDIIYKKPKN